MSPINYCTYAIRSAAKITLSITFHTLLATSCHSALNKTTYWPRKANIAESLSGYCDSDRTHKYYLNITFSFYYKKIEATHYLTINLCFQNTW